MSSYDEYYDENELLQNMNDHLIDQERKRTYEHSSQERINSLSSKYNNKFTLLNDDINSILNCLIFIDENIHTSYDFSKINIPNKLKGKILSKIELGAALEQDQQNNERIIQTNIMNKLLSSVYNSITRDKLVNELFLMLNSKFNEKYKDEMEFLTDSKGMSNDPSKDKIHLVISCGKFILDTLLNEFNDIKDLDILFSSTNNNYSNNDYVLKVLHDNEITKKEYNGLWVFSDENVKVKIKKIILSQFAHMEMELIHYIVSNQNLNELYQEMRHQRVEYDIRHQTEDDLYISPAPLYNYCRYMTPYFKPSDNEESNKCSFCNNFISNDKKYRGSLFEYTSDIDEIIPLIYVLQIFNHGNGNYYSKCIGYLNPTFSNTSVEKYLRPKNENNHVLQLTDGSLLSDKIHSKNIKLKRIDTFIPSSNINKHNKKVFINFILTFVFIVLISIIIYIIYDNYKIKSMKKQNIRRRIITPSQVKQINSYYRYGEGFRTFT